MKEFPLNNPLLTKDQFDQMYQESFADKEKFWAKIAREQISWFKDFTKIKKGTPRECLFLWLKVLLSKVLWSKVLLF